MNDTEQSRSPAGNRRANQVYRAMWIACVLLLAADVLVHKHGEFAFEEWFGFHALFGLAAGLLVVLLARLLRAAVQRPEDFYERR
ncbi:MAG TPA: hypothetical protein VGE20_18465 [Ramlibacter sp.]